MLYDFQCIQCKHIFEDLIKSEEPNPVCPKCSLPTDKLICAPQHYNTTKTDLFNHFANRYPGLKKYEG